MSKDPPLTHAQIISTYVQDVVLIDFIWSGRSVCHNISEVSVHKTSVFGAGSTYHAFGLSLFQMARASLALSELCSTLSSPT